MSLLPVAEAVERAIAGLGPIGTETVPLACARGRVLAGDLAALRTQPPFANSAMDGYAVRHADVARTPAILKVIGTAPAGHPFDGRIGDGEAVRIFTGGVVPDGADAVVMQENATEADGFVTVVQPVAEGRFIRRAGLDFVEGEVLLTTGRRIGPRDVALAAAANHTEIPVYLRPRVAILATGDEIVPPGHPRARELTVSSNSYGLAAFIEALGGIVLDLGIAPDDTAAIASAIAGTADADLLVTLGGASVGEHDLVRDALADAGLELDFWRIAMRPGKPLMYGRLGAARFLGLPGNPVSAMVCAQLFLKPMLRALLGLEPDDGGQAAARLGAPLKANDERQDYLRARLESSPEGPVATAFTAQDSSMLRLLQTADCLIVRPPHAPAAASGEIVPILPIDL